MDGSSSKKITSGMSMRLRAFGTRKTHRDMTVTKSEDSASKRSKPDDSQCVQVNQSSPRKSKYPNQSGKTRQNPIESGRIRYCLRSGAKNISNKSVTVKSSKIANMPGIDQTIAPSNGGIPNGVSVTSSDTEFQSKCNGDNGTEEIKGHLSRLGIEHERVKMGAPGDADVCAVPLHGLPTAPDSTDAVHEHAWPANSAKRPYKIGGKLGSGSEGTVYAGTRKADGVPVAIKKIRKAKIKRWGKIDDYDVPIELELHHKVSGHPAIIAMLDWFEATNEFVLVLERQLDMMDLFDYNSRLGPLSEASARTVYQQLAEAILHCHDHGVVHRDVKEENVLINKETFQVKLIDFGCGCHLQEAPHTVFIGTREYFPPECFTEGHCYGRRIDAWCLGFLLFMLLENAEPFKSKEDIIRSKIRFTRGVELTNSCKDFVRLLLRKDQYTRPSVSEALRHKWFKS